MASLAPEISKRIESILNAPNANFVELAQLAGFEPSKDFRFIRVRDVDFYDCDLAGFDFTGAHFQNCSFQGARIAGATFLKSKFDQSDLRLADDWRHLNQPPNLISLPKRSTHGINHAVETSFGIGHLGGRSALAAMPTRQEFAALLVEQHGIDVEFEGSVVNGIVTAIQNDHAMIDVGLKSEGRVALREFSMPGQPLTLKVGDQVEVYVDRVENMSGEAVLSRDRARREAAWDTLESAFAAGNRVEGVIFGRVKGGFTVDLGGAVAFLPGSQVDVRPVRDVAPLMDNPQPFQILKMDRKRGNIVVSRRMILEESRAEARSGLLLNLKEGQVIEGIVKNITDYGAFVDLGGIDGLLHVTDISYKRVNHPSEIINIGDSVKVQIIRINRDTQRISLGMKQLERDPWEAVVATYPVGKKFSGRVTNITEYGAFIELEAGIEGLVHVSEMSWTKKNVHPGEIVSTSQKVDVMVLEVDQEKRRISLGLKQAITNPWEGFASSHPVGTQVEGEVKNATEFGLFIGLDGDVDGMVHMSDIAWGISGEEALRLHRKGETVKAVVLDIDAEKERISLGIKQLVKGTPAAGGLKKGATVAVTVLEVRNAGLVAQIDEVGGTGFIKRSELGRDRDEQRPDNFQIGQKLDVIIIGFTRSKEPLLSVKAQQFWEDRQAIDEFGSSNLRTSLGDILSEVLRTGSKKGR